MVRLRRSTPGTGGLRAGMRGFAARRRELAVPPAWTAVWISADPLGHIQATGVDAAGRTQYLYHPAWRERRDLEKFERAAALAAALPAARGRVTRLLADPPADGVRSDDRRDPADGHGADARRARLSRERVLAGAFRIVDRAMLRAGGEEYAAQNGSRGTTTLLGRDVHVDGDTVRFRFPGKSGVPWDTTVTDAPLAALVRELREARGPRRRLLAWWDAEREAWHPVGAHELNEEVRAMTGGDFTAKDFRTVAGTLAAAEFLARQGPPRSERTARRTIAAASRHVAELLGNTPAVARGSYIDPRVLERYRRGDEPRPW